MIFKAQPITWDLKPGVKLPFGPEDDFIHEQQPINNDANTNAIFEKPKELVSSFLGDSVTDETVHSNNVPVKAMDQNVVELKEQIQNVQPKNLVIHENMSPHQTGQIQNLVDNPENLSEQIQNNVEIQSVSSSQDVAFIKDSVTVPLQPILTDNTLYNVATSVPMVDGIAITSTQDILNQGNLPRWMQLPYKLRSKRADIFVNLKSSADFVTPLVSFLRNKGLDVKEYDDSVHYLPSDILLLDSSDVVDSGTVYVLQNGKKYIWDALQNEFGDKLSG